MSKPTVRNAAASQPMRTRALARTAASVDVERRVIVHWTAGSHRASDFDRRAYHILIEGDGRIVRGTPSIAANSGTLKPGYAAHTLNANSDSIGVSLCCMADAIENPFSAGTFPMTETQFDRAAAVVAELCAAYDIPVGPRTVLTHAEVEPTLGIRQRAKWDYTRLAFDSQTRGARAIGDLFRSRVSAALGAPASPDIALPPPAGGRGTVTASSLILRRGPSTSTDSIGSIPRGVEITLLEPSESGEWLRIRTPYGAEGWVSAQHVEITDGPEPEAPTTPHPARAAIADIRNRLDLLEAMITGV